MSATGIFGLVLCVVLLIVLVLVSALFLKAQRELLDHADRVHQRATVHQQMLLDRLMATDLAEYKGWQMAENAPKGGYEEPDEPPTEIIRLPGLEVAE